MSLYVIICHMKIIFANIIERLGWAFIIWTTMSSEPVESIRNEAIFQINNLFIYSEKAIEKVENIIPYIQNFLNV